MSIGPNEQKFTRYNSITFDRVEMAFHLIFSEDGSLRLTRAEPDLARGERSMALTLRVPRSLWRTAQLTAEISIADPGNPKATVDVAAAAAAIRETLGDGVNIELTVKGDE